MEQRLSLDNMNSMARISEENVMPVAELSRGAAQATATAFVVLFYIAIAMRPKRGSEQLR